MFSASVLTRANTSFPSGWVIWKCTEQDACHGCHTRSALRDSPVHALGRRRVGTESTVVTLVPAFEKCQDEWKSFLDDKEKIIGAWGLAHSWLSPSTIKKAQMRMCAEITHRASQMSCGTGYGMALDLVGQACRVLLGLLPKGAAVDIGRGGLSWLRSPKQELRDDNIDIVSQRQDRGSLHEGLDPWGPLSGPQSHFLNVKATYLSGTVMG